MDGTSVELYFYLFLAGMAACLLASNRMPNQIRIVAGMLAIGVLVAIPLSSDAMVSRVWQRLPLISASTSLNGWNHPEIWGFFFFVLCIGLSANGTFVSRVSSLWVLRHIGLLSYGIYLFHIPVMISLRPLNLQSEAQFLTVFVFTYIVAIASYIVVEKPFLMLKPMLKASGSGRMIH